MKNRLSIAGVHIDVVTSRPFDDRRLEIVFSDGTRGCVDIASLVPFDGVFAPLKDEAYFRSVTVNAELGTIVWPTGADLCPDVLHDAIRAGAGLPT